MSTLNPGVGTGAADVARVDLDGTLEQTRAAWNAIAAGYDAYVTPTNDWALPREALKRAGLRAGMHLLDVACGSGAVALPAARAGARVTAVDLSPAMIERLAARARVEGLADLQARVMDGHALAFDDGAFDIAASQFGVMLFPDLPRALRELVRVTRPGGRVLLIALGAPHRVEFLTFFLAALEAVVPGFEGLPTDPPPLPFQLADPEVMRRRLAEAGLTRVAVEPAAEELEFGSGQDMWNWVVNSNPVAVSLIAGLSERQRREVIDVLDGMLRERAGLGDAAILTAAVNIGIGTKDS
jgi:ubiquinone/menaquinone biosynthesis C-methylase UbiE